MLPLRASNYTFIGLNVVRMLSIIALLLVFSSSIVIMVHDIEAVNRFVASGKVVGDESSGNSTTTATPSTDYVVGSTVPNQPAGVFWAVLNRLLIIGQVVVLLLSEVGWPAAFFNRFFPILGKDFGLGALGIIQCLIGAAVLSHHVDDFALVSAFFLFSIGCLNMLVGLIWRGSARSKRSVMSFRDRAKDAKNMLPTSIKANLPMSTGSTGAVDLRPALSNASSYLFPGGEKSRAEGMGFGRQGEKSAALKGFMISKPVESLPRYAPAHVAHHGDGTGVKVTTESFTQ
ncbi:hypothetical protein HGRIS_006668 [Hohenbuehelia grisea]|uniref:DUF7598 domain-containing protein n=1 Tax=Hohenbuehelia grisea TaxID=104357 RepID=A0ABR3J9Y6_9AGAR